MEEKTKIGIQNKSKVTHDENLFFDFVTDDVNDSVRAPKILRNRPDALVEKYDFNKKMFIEDVEMCRIYTGSLIVTSVSEKEAYASIEKYTKRFYS